MSSVKHEESGYNLDLNLLNMLTKRMFLYHMRSGLVEKNKIKNHLRPTSLKGWTR
jgi:hypothetical protein